MFRDISVAVIAFLFGSAVIWVVSLLSSSDLPVWGYLLGGSGVAILATFVIRRWREAIWGNIAKWRPMTTVGTLSRLREEVIAELEAEAAEKALVPSIRAQWRISLDPMSNGEWRISNVAIGSFAKNVSVHYLPSRLRAGSALDWPAINGGAFEEFEGVPTEDSSKFGIDLKVSWTNERGDYLEVDVSWEYKILPLNPPPISKES